MPKIALDVHAHLIPIDSGRLLHLDGVSWAESERSLTVDGHRIGFRDLFDPAALVAWMDQHGVATAWVSLPPPAYRQGLGEPSMDAWAGYVNDGLRSIGRQYPGRLAPLFHLPIEHPALAARIARRWIGEGHARFAAACGAPGAVLSDPAYEELWIALDAGASFLFMHPGEGCDGRLERFYLHNLLGNPTETALAVSHLVFAGVTERFPGIRFCLAHGGGTTAAVAGRLVRGQSTGRPGVPASVDIGRAMRRFCVDCITHDAAALELAAAVHGEDNLMFGSDWPFPMGVLDPAQQLAGVPRSLLDKMFDENPARIMRSVGR